MSTHQPPMPQAPAAAPDWQAAPGGTYPGYTSPIPVVRTHLGHALVSEWTKIKSVRSTMWTLGVFVVLVLGIGLMAGLAVSSSGDMNGENPLTLGFFGLLLGSICIITLGVLTTASEYGTGMIRTTMTACPSRGRVLAAKAIVFFVVAFVVTLVASTLVAMMQTALLDGHAGARTPSGGEWLKGTVGVSLYIALLGLLSLLVGSMIRHSAGAITIMIGLVLAPLVIALFMFASSLEKVRQFLLEYSIPTQLGTFYGSSLSDSGPSGWDPLWIILVITAVAFGGAFALLQSRDV
ncbi:ABC transporter permease subunit [Streptomyces sp. L2]|uniref:ABC transporter permease subunit n=1 Tax=Streptomyces sp. L2 TaxID=2162665 RepID=UPI001012962F|nr:ABC transporter permease subunit [Streptomyces sp. L2]